MIAGAFPSHGPRKTQQKTFHKGPLFGDFGVKINSVLEGIKNNVGPLSLMGILTAATLGGNSLIGPAKNPQISNGISTPPGLVAVSLSPVPPIDQEFLQKLLGEPVEGSASTQEVIWFETERTFGRIMNERKTHGSQMLTAEQEIALKKTIARLFWAKSLLFDERITYVDFISKLKGPEKMFCEEGISLTFTEHHSPHKEISGVFFPSSTQGDRGIRVDVVLK